MNQWLACFFDWGSTESYSPPPGGWVCFHCGQRFRSPRRAEEHFGKTPSMSAACQLTEERVRELRVVEDRIRNILKEK